LTLTNYSEGWREQPFIAAFFGFLVAGIFFNLVFFYRIFIEIDAGYVSFCGAKERAAASGTRVLWQQAC